MRGKLIVIEGTDCSGKETQSKLLGERLNNLGIETEVIDFPNYDSPTGRVFGTCYLGKKDMCKEHLVSGDGWFLEGASKVDPLVASLYVAADRRYNVGRINQLLDSGINVILDRYVYSNMAHQGGKIENQEKFLEFIKKIEVLEFDLLELPRPDLKLFLHVPTNIACELKKGRLEVEDQHEKDFEHLFKAEETYLKIKDLYDMVLIECTIDGSIRSIDDINEELVEIVTEFLMQEGNNNEEVC